MGTRLNSEACADWLWKLPRQNSTTSPILELHPNKSITTVDYKFELCRKLTAKIIPTPPRHQSGPKLLQSITTVYYQTHTKNQTRLNFPLHRLFGTDQNFSYKQNCLRNRCTQLFFQNYKLNDH